MFLLSASTICQNLLIALLLSANVNNKTILEKIFFRSWPRNLYILLSIFFWQISCNHTWNQNVVCYKFELIYASLINHCLGTSEELFQESELLPLTPNSDKDHTYVASLQLIDKTCFMHKKIVSDSAYCIVLKAKLTVCVIWISRWCYSMLRGESFS